MTWQVLLEESEEALRIEDATEAFRRAFGALEVCYTNAASERGWIPSTNNDSTFSEAIRFLGGNKAITQAQFSMAQHLGWARNAVSHRFGFEPSLRESKRTLEKVRSLCARFGRTVADVMVKPVVTASPDQHVGEIIKQIVENGISQFPVVDGGKVVGTLLEEHVFKALGEGEGILDPTTQVNELMDDKPLPSINSNATLDDARSRLSRQATPALLIIHDGLPTGIVTKYDLIRHLEV
jgi:predicted transcriptional regulator